MITEQVQQYVDVEYKFEAGPREIFPIRREEIEQANCQLAFQVFYEKLGIILPREAAFSSAVYNKTGVLYAEEYRELFQDYEVISRLAKPALAICALRKEKYPSLPSFDEIERNDELQRSLHLAAFIGKRDSWVMRSQFPSLQDTIAPTNDDTYIFHACLKDNKVTVWDTRKMLDEYWLIRFKEIVPFPSITL